MTASSCLLHRAAILAALCLAASPAVVASSMAPVRDAYSVEVLVDGVPLPEYASGGTTYIEAVPNREYAIRLTNRTPQRVAVALSVDGLNSIDAKTTSSRAASKWILGPYQTITLEGWQTSSATARRFFFTTERGSYGSWLGRTRNLGIITAAVFRERRPQPYPIWKDEDSGGDSRLRPESAAPEGGARAQGLTGEPKAADDLAATGIGQEVGHNVTRVPFDAEGSPAVVLNLRYEYRDELVRLGVLPRPVPPCDDRLARRERARGFEDTGFAPDPYRPRCP